VAETWRRQERLFNFTGAAQCFRHPNAEVFRQGCSVWVV